FTLHVPAGVDRDDAWQGRGRGGIDGPDARMGMGTAHENRIHHPRQLDVVGVVPLSGNEARVFLTLDGCAENGRGRAHRPPPPPSPDPDSPAAAASRADPAPASSAAAYSIARTMFWYPVQRQYTPSSSRRIVSASGWGFFCNSP